MGRAAHLGTRGPIGRSLADPTACAEPAGLCLSQHSPARALTKVPRPHRCTTAQSRSDAVSPLVTRRSVDVLEIRLGPVLLQDGSNQPFDTNRGSVGLRPALNIGKSQCS